MIIDTHSHYNLDPFWTDWTTHWLKAQAAGVHQSIVVGVNAETSKRAVTLAHSDENLFAAIGYHPTEKENVDIATLETLLPNKKIIAIGETGLDYFHSKDVTEISEQKKYFALHIRLAKKYSLPLIIHCRDRSEQAYWDVLEILHTEKFSGTFILHCVSGPLAYIQEAVTMGAYFGIAGNMTYKNSEHLRDIVRAVPKDRLLLETDAPFLPPQEFRGKVCEPWMISKTAEYVSPQFNVELDQLYQNSLQAFGLLP